MKVAVFATARTVAAEFGELARQGLFIYEIQKIIGRQVTIDNEEVCIGVDGVLDEPFQTLRSVREVSIFLDVSITAMGDLHPRSTPSMEHFVGPTLVNKNHSQHEDDGHDDVGEGQY